MKRAALISRCLLGLIFVVFGANKWFHFAPVPMPAGDAGAYYSLLFSHHIMAVVAAFEIAGGALLLVGRYVPLGLSLLAPVVVNILMYHLFFDSSRIALGLVSALLEAFLLYAYRSSFAGVLALKPEPA